MQSLVEESLSWKAIQDLPSFACAFPASCSSSIEKCLSWSDRVGEVKQTKSYFELPCIHRRTMVGEGAKELDLLYVWRCMEEMAREERGERREGIADRVNLGDKQNNMEERL